MLVFRGVYVYTKQNGGMVEKKINKCFWGNEIDIEKKIVSLRSKLSN